VYRYFLLREIPFGQDGNFSEDAILTRLQSDLANDLGNLVNRTLSMIERYCGGHIPQTQGSSLGDDEALKQAALALPGVLGETMQRVEFSSALEAMMRVASQANQYIETSAPWKLAKQEATTQRLHTVLGVLAEVIRIVTIVLEPFMPSVSAAIWQQLGCGDRIRRLQDAEQWSELTPGQPIGPHPVLFPKGQQ
jgi:methionyl-tRNA synthetase